MTLYSLSDDGDSQGTIPMQLLEMLPLVVSLRGFAVLDAAVPADLGSIVLPPWLTRWALSGQSVIAGNTANGCSVITESSAGTLAAGTFELRTAAGGGGVNLAAAGTNAFAGAPGSVQGIRVTPGYHADPAIFIRQIAPAAVPGTASIFLTIMPVIAP